MVDAVAVVQFMFIPYFINFNTNINYFKHAVCVLRQGSWRSFWKETGNKRRRVFPKIGNLSQFISFVCIADTFLVFAQTACKCVSCYASIVCITGISNRSAANNDN